MKPMLPTYFLHEHLWVTQNFIFSLKLLRQIAFLSSWGRNSHILGTKDKIRSVPIKKQFCFFFLCSILLFLRLYGFFKNYDKSEIIAVEVPCFALKISVGKIFWFILTLFPLKSNSSKGNFRESSHTNRNSVSWILLTLLSMSLLLKQKLRGFIKI